MFFASRLENIFEPGDSAALVDARAATGVKHLLFRLRET
jgi:hypothetical protein